jgi:hypothetical protein
MKLGRCKAQPLQTVIPGRSSGAKLLTDWCGFASPYGELREALWCRSSFT